MYLLITTNTSEIQKNAYIYKKLKLLEYVIFNFAIFDMVLKMLIFKERMMTVVGKVLYNFANFIWEQVDDRERKVWFQFIFIKWTERNTSSLLLSICQLILKLCSCHKRRKILYITEPNNGTNMWKASLGLKFSYLAIICHLS